MTRRASRFIGLGIAGILLLAMAFAQEAHAQGSSRFIDVDISGSGIPSHGLYDTTTYPAPSEFYFTSVSYWTGTAQEYAWVNQGTCTGGDTEKVAVHHSVRIVITDVHTWEDGIVAMGPLGLTGCQYQYQGVVATLDAWKPYWTSTIQLNVYLSFAPAAAATVLDYCAPLTYNGHIVDYVTWRAVDDMTYNYLSYGSELVYYVDSLPIGYLTTPAWVSETTSEGLSNVANDYYL